MKLFRTKYRIIRTRWDYIAQFRPWWSPFWLECFGWARTNTLRDAEDLARFHKNQVLTSFYKEDQ